MIVQVAAANAETTDSRQTLRVRSGGPCGVARPASSIQRAKRVESGANRAGTLGESVFIRRLDAGRPVFLAVRVSYGVEWRGDHV